MKSPCSYGFYFFFRGPRFAIVPHGFPEFFQVLGHFCTSSLQLLPEQADLGRLLRGIRGAWREKIWQEWEAWMVMIIVVVVGGGGGDGGGGGVGVVVTTLIIEYFYQ